MKLINLLLVAALFGANAFALDADNCQARKDESFLQKSDDQESKDFQNEILASKSSTETPASKFER